jgi:Zn-dependent peptidase ImmA (M78 family)
MAEVPVNGRVLKWARLIRGLSLQDAASLLGVTTDELEDYELRNKKPLIGFLRRMSDKYQINFTSLLMPEPLPKRNRPADHRERHGKRPLSIDTLVAIEEITEALDTFDDIATEVRQVVPALSIGTARISDDPSAIAARERKRFGVPIEEQHAWRDTSEARRRWREVIEKHGIFTYMIPMPITELSGFSILRNNLAAICVNDLEATEGAKIFTLFHEYCHLLLRRTGISDQNNHNRVERFCNKFAASFLIPFHSLTYAIGEIKTPYEFSDADIKRLATRFRVSNSAIALRLEETGLASKGFYERRTAPWDIPKAPRPIKPGQKLSPIRTRIKRSGRLHMSTTLEALRRRAINSFDASQLIGLGPGSFVKIEARIG